MDLSAADALVGIVIGAVVAGMVRIDVERRLALRADRRDAYLEFVLVVETFGHADERRPKADRSTRPEVPPGTTERLYEACAKVNLLAPARTAIAAERVADILLADQWDAKAVADKGPRSPVGHFLRLAARDVGARWPF